ncbi:MAG: hypothetical protein ACRCYP_01195 [Alphaproteobacteria bacterium]
MDSRSIDLLPPKKELTSFFHSIGSFVFSPRFILPAFSVNFLFTHDWLTFGLLFLASLVTCFEKTRQRISSKLKARVYAIGGAFFSASMAFPALAFTPPAACTGGVLSSVAGPFVYLATSAGLVDITQNICDLNLNVTLVVVVLAIAALVFGVFKGLKDGDWFQGFLPLAAIIMIWVGAATIGKLGTAGFTAGGGAAP